MGQIPNALGERLHQLDRDALTTLAEALCAQLTRHGGFHGGVRPENIVYDGPEAVTLGAPARTDTRDWGTQELEFMAPEVFWSGELAPSADVYSVGLLLYAGVHGGLLPFYPQNPAPNDRAEALRRRMNGETLPMPKSAGRPLAAIIQKATQFRAEDRYQTPEELAAALRRYREELHAAAPTAQEMFEKPGEVSSMAIRLRQGADTQSAKQHIQQQVGPHYRVLDRYEQQEDVFRIMKVEKLMAYLFLTFILFIASFNIIASLSMLIIDKRDDIQTLRDLGAQETTIRRIFLTEGRLISLAGAVIGILVGLLLCWIQMQFGLIRLGEEAGTFIIDAYPVSVHPVDILVTLVTVVAVSFAACWYPVRYLSRRLLREQKQ